MPDRRRVLLTVSGYIPSDLEQQVSDGLRPRADYQVIADHTDADVVDVERALRETGRLGPFLHRVGGAALLLGWYCFRRRSAYRVLLTDGEGVGIPLAMLTRVFGRRGCKHVMIAHVLSVPKKSLLVRAARIAGQIDCYIVYCTSQARFVRDRLGVGAERIVLTPFMVDSQFFSRGVASASQRRLICCAGLERRDYPTLLAAVDGLDVRVVITATSLWSKQRDDSARTTLPPNVEIRRLSWIELRQLYADAAFAVMPLVEVDFQAGITTILEAMSMQLPVVCTRTSGQTDTVVENVTGTYVPVADPTALRRSIEQMLDDTSTRERMGQTARQWVTKNADIEIYAKRLAVLVAAMANDEHEIVRLREDV